MIVCRVCGRTFENMASLAGHIRGHNQTSFQQILIEALNKQNELLERILVELEEIHRLLEGLNVIEAKVEETRVEATSRAIASISHRTKEEANHKAKTSKEESSLPSFLRDNPWVEVLRKQVLEEDKK
jgi:hypothetical protein